MAEHADGSALDRVITEFDATAYQASEHDAHAQRRETLARYPRAHWREMALEEYAQGQADRPDSLCRWIERQTDEMGSIRGGSARKLIIYKHRDKAGWYFPRSFGDERAAWQAVRAGFLTAFELADRGRFEDVDDIEPLSSGAALVTKILWVYFPDELLPINSSANLRHFLRVVGREDLAADHSLRTIRLNRALLAELRSHAELRDASTKALERFLYIRFTPFEGRVVKISPGRDARFWPECRAGNYICVGWEKVGDLRQYESRDAFLGAFRDAYQSEYSTEAKLREKASEVWLLLDLAVGERIVANKGIKEILAVGTIESPGYVWDPSLGDHNHTLRVHWDESYAAEIPPQHRWAFKTVLPLSGKVRDIVLGDEPTSAGDDEPPAPPPSTETPIFERLGAALERKNQVILYGPPGTGKTWHASGFARWWLRQRNADAPSPRRPAASFGTGAGQRAWLVSTNPGEWRWDELFHNGEEIFRRGRIDRNYELVAPGDLVFGYTATPLKRIEALARVARLARRDDASTFVLAPLVRVADGPRWAELQDDERLSASEPVRHRMQGTLFHLTPSEADGLLAMIGERDTEAAEVGAGGSWSGSTDPDPVGEALEWVTFHPSYSYEDFVEGFRPARVEGGASLELEDGIFKTMCRKAIANPGRTYLLVIDEINRANVTKVFGELITLLESDKRRADATAGYAVRLPYSKERFVIPPNLFILGTMNTADRTIKMLDTALRRRFGFVELMPDPSLLSAHVGGLPLDDLLRRLNARVAREAGREKQIGHSFFLRGEQPVTDESEFAEIFRDEIVPLLQDYAADDYDELLAYLGPRIVDQAALTLDAEVLSDPSLLLDALESHLLQAVDET